MHPIMHHRLTDDWLADRHRQAERDRPARTARLARRGPSRLPSPTHRAMALARRGLAMLGGRRLRRVRATPAEVLPPPT
jgi:hypothetical protein